MKARRHIIIVSLCAAAVGIGFAVRGQAGEGPQLRAKQMNARHNGGLRAAAAITGSFVADVPTNEGSPVSLTQLVAFSTLIVVGDADRNVSRLTDSGRSIVSYYQVRVQSVLKGSESSAFVTVAVPGGKVSFEDGSWAQLNAPGFRRPMNGTEYVWCLRPVRPSMMPDDNSGRNEGPIYSPAFGPLGIYDVSDATGRVKPAGGASFPFARRLARQGFTPDTFVAAVRDEAGR